MEGEEGVSRKENYSGTDSWWLGALYLETEQNLRKIIGYRDLWMLQAVLDEKEERQEQALAA